MEKNCSVDQQASLLILRRSAELHSAVSQNCILRGVRNLGSQVTVERPAESNSAIQQITNLRYSFYRLPVHHKKNPPDASGGFEKKDASGFSEYLGSLIVIFFGRDLVHLVLPQQFRQALFFGS
jgi:hypothetical protein